MHPAIQRPGLMMRAFKMRISEMKPHTATCCALVVALAACSANASDKREAAGSVDTSIAKTSAVVDAAGPGAHVTRTDFRSVKKAEEFRLTPINFSRFMAAADSLVARSRRDEAMRDYLGANITDAGSTEDDAGLKWLAASPAVVSAINSAGMSVRDYFVASIAIASAQRFMADPSAAPATPSLAENATFLRQHQSDLQTLAALRENRPVVTSTP
jgi:hypothetical protein